MRRYSDRPDVYISVAEISVRDRWERSARGEPVPQQWTAAQFDRAPVLALRLAPELGGQHKADAMQREDPAAWPAMVAQHAACLIALTSAAARAMADEPGGELGAPEIGLPVLMFAGELAAILQPGEHRDQIPASLVAVSEQSVTTATLTAAGCLAGLVDAIQTLSALAS